MHGEFSAVIAYSWCSTRTLILSSSFVSNLFKQEGQVSIGIFLTFLGQTMVVSSFPLPPCISLEVWLPRSSREQGTWWWKVGERLLSGGHLPAEARLLSMAPWVGGLASYLPGLL